MTNESLIFLVFPNILQFGIRGHILRCMYLFTCALLGNSCHRKKMVFPRQLPVDPVEIEVELSKGYPVFLCDEEKPNSN